MIALLLAPLPCQQGKAEACIAAVLKALNTTDREDWVSRRSLYAAMANAQASLKLYADAGVSWHGAWEANCKAPGMDAESGVAAGEFFLSRDRLPEAAAVLNELMEREPTYAPAWLATARLRVAQNRREDAVLLAERALDLGQKSQPPLSLERQRDIRLFLSINYHALGQEARAREHQLWIQQNR